jgi:hypothetical protein
MGIATCILTALRVLIRRRAEWLNQRRFQTLPSRASHEKRVPMEKSRAV